LIKTTNKKAFTLLEIIIALAIIAAIAITQHIVDTGNQRLSYIKDSYVKFDKFIQNGLLDDRVGYIREDTNSTNCSQDLSFKDITAERIRECSQLNNFNIAGNVNDTPQSTNPHETYLIDIAREVFFEGGKIYFGNEDADGNLLSGDKVYIYFDFSAALDDDEEGAKKDRKLIEEYYLSEINNGYITKLVKAYPKATSYGDIKNVGDGDLNPDGTTIDGKFGVMLQH
jgi:prepilin-type N-terminal cleavage/methylation domain-containing protein